MVVLYILLGTIAFFAALFVLIGVASRVTLNAIKGPLKERVAARIPTGDVVMEELGANNIGITSKGRGQMRGNGALVLTKRAVHFFQLIPASELEIPLEKIRSIDLVRSHLGKSVGYKLLKLEYETAAGPDSVAWFVPDVEAWKRGIEGARS